jgi:hypothetical protein
VKAFEKWITHAAFTALTLNLPAELEIQLAYDDGTSEVFIASSDMVRIIDQRMKIQMVFATYFELPGFIFGDSDNPSL